MRTATANASDPARRRRRSARLAAAALVGAAVAAPAGWVATDRLERDDDFCVACHLGDGTRLHARKREDHARRPAATLAAAHAEAGVREAGDARGFRCIDCHGGTGALGRLRVKVLSAKDAFWYAVGRFEEPTAMRWPLRDEDCRRCHPRFDESARAAVGTRAPAFHELAVHNTELGVACVGCHLAHDEGGLADHDFVHPEHVRARCAECHPELAP